MGRYFLRRLIMLIPILVGVVVIVFTINYFSPVSPASVIMGGLATEEQIEAKAEELGLNDPYLTQLRRYFLNIITKGSLGDSFIHKTPVLGMILDRLPKTLLIGVLSATLSILIGIPLGILAAVKQNSPLDFGATFLSILCGAIPAFCLCLILQLIFAVNLHWVPVSGVKTWKGFILPVVACGILPVAMTTRMTRSAMLETIRQDYIRTARAKGVSERTVIWRHALKNALIPIITVVGMNYALAMTGSIISETIFNIPGMGLLMNTSISQKDYITTQGCVMVAAFIISFVTLLTDMVYALIDPRIKAQYTSGSTRSGRDKKREKKGAAV